MIELVKDMAFQMMFIAFNVYFESQGEPWDGKVAVAHVTFQRIEERGKSAKEIVFEPWQFSWTMDDLQDIVKYMDTFAECGAAVAEAQRQRMTGNHFFFANLYHSKDMNPFPSWSREPNVRKVTEIGNHIFYRENRKPWGIR